VQLVDRCEIVERQRIDAASRLGKDGKECRPQVAAAVMRRDPALDYCRGPIRRR
jgi:hypothetical protein